MKKLLLLFLLCPSVSFGQIQYLKTNGTNKMTAPVEVDTSGGTNAKYGESAIDLNSGSTETLTLHNSGAGRLDVFVEGAVDLGDLASAPGSPVNGMMYYDTTLSKIRCYQAGSWTDCIGSAGITGTVGINQCVYGTGASSVSSEAACTYDPSTNTLTTDTIKAGVAFSPVAAAQYVSGIYTSPNLDSPVSSQQTLSYKVLIPSDGLPIVISKDNAALIKADKCTTTACTTTTTTTVISDSYSNLALNWDAFVTPAGKPAIVYTSTSTSTSYIHYCYCNNDSCSSGVTCKNDAVFINDPAVRGYQFVANKIGTGVGIFYTIPWSPSDMVYYVFCSDPDSGTPCTSISSPVALNSADLAGGNPLAIIENTDGTPLLYSDVRRYKCSDTSCTAYPSIAVGAEVTSIQQSRVTIIGSDLYMMGGNDLYPANTRSLYKVALPAAASASVVQTFDDDEPPALNWYRWDYAFLASVTKSASGFPVILMTPPDTTSGDLVTYRLIVCSDINCSSYTKVDDTDLDSYSDGFSFYLNHAAVIPDTSDIVFMRGERATGSYFYRNIVVYQLGSQTVSGVPLGANATRLSEGYFNGLVKVGSMKVDGPGPSFGNIGIGADAVTNLDNAGDMSVRFYSVDTSFSGTQNNLNLGRYSSVRLNGSSTPVITGIKANNQNGKILILTNAGATTIQINNQDSNSTASNRIITGTGANVNLAADETILLVYDTLAPNRWRKLK